MSFYNSLSDRVGTKVLGQNSKGGTVSAPFLATHCSLEYSDKLVVLQLTLKKCCPPVEDERICHDVPGKCKMSADLRILWARIDVPGVVNGVHGVLVRLCWAHVQEKRVLLEGHEVNF